MPLSAALAGGGVIQPLLGLFVCPRDGEACGCGHTLAKVNDDVLARAQTFCPRSLHRCSVGRSTQGDQQAYGKSRSHRIFAPGPHGSFREPERPSVARAGASWDRFSGRLGAGRDCPLSIMCVPAAETPRRRDFTFTQISGMMCDVRSYSSLSAAFGHSIWPQFLIVVSPKASISDLTSG